MKRLSCEYNVMSENGLKFYSRLTSQWRSGGSDRHHPSKLLFCGGIQFRILLRAEHPHNKLYSLRIKQEKNSWSLQA